MKVTKNDGRLRPPIIYPFISISFRSEGDSLSSSYDPFYRLRLSIPIIPCVSAIPTLPIVFSDTIMCFFCPPLSVCDHPIRSQAHVHASRQHASHAILHLPRSTSSLPQPSPPLSLGLCLLFPSFPSTHRVRHHYSSSSAVLIHLVSHHHLDIFLSLTPTAPHREASPLSLIPSHSLQKPRSPYSFLLPYLLNHHLTHITYNLISSLKQNNYLIISRISLNIQSF